MHTKTTKLDTIRQQTSDSNKTPQKTTKRYTDKVIKGKLTGDVYYGYHNKMGRRNGKDGEMTFANGSFFKGLFKEG